MELLLIAGLAAVIVLAIVGIFYFLQQRRSGTVRGTLTPPGGQAEGEPDTGEDGA